MAGDRIEQLGRSTVQHGKGSDRIYLMKLHPDDGPEIVERLDQLAAQKRYTKIFAKVPAKMAAMFHLAGYVTEAAVPAMYAGEDDGLFLGKYLDLNRQQMQDRERIDDVLDICAAKTAGGAPKRGAAECSIRLMTEQEAGLMAALFDTVFDSYPFPIHDPAFIVETMHSHVQYYGAFGGERLLALSSAEMDQAALCVEMTDFATLPQARGRGLAGLLLLTMERAMQQQGMRTAYTIARAVSYGMNIAFARAGYHLGGTLINNTNISGGLESMNVWYRSLLRANP